MGVICWLCVDMFLVMGTSDTVQDVCMDALGLAFLYNLDDVGGDLGFLDEDDWPGLQLAWLSKNIHQYADDISDVEQKEADSMCLGLLDCVGYILGLACLILPCIFIVTPFQELKPDPAFEEMMTNKVEFEAWLTNFIRQATTAPHADL